MNGAVTATTPIRPCGRPRALGFGRKRSRSTTSSTACRVAGATSGRLFSTRETVATETPASRATSRIVVRLSRRVTARNVRESTSRGVLVARDGGEAPAGGGFVDHPVLGRSGDGRLELFTVGADGNPGHRGQTSASNGRAAWQSEGTGGGGTRAAPAWQSG